MSGDARSRADLQPISNGQLGPEMIGDIIFHLFSYVVQSKIRLSDAIPRFQQAKFSQDELFSSPT
jgi:hypothetical protein